MSEAKKLEKSARYHTSAAKEQKYKEQIEDCPIELKRPTVVTPNTPLNNPSSTYQ